MSSYFRACAKSTPDLVTDTPEALAIIRGDVPPDVEPVEDDIDHDGVSAAPQTQGILGPVTVAFKRPTTDPRNIDTVISQTRALLDGPAAEAMRREARRQQALEARELEQAARDAERARAIDERNARLLAELRAKKGLDASTASASKSADGTSPAAHPEPRTLSTRPDPEPRPGTVLPADAAELPVPVAIDTMDAYSRLRVEEARRRLDDAKRGSAGHSIVATYIAEDVALCNNEVIAAKAQQLVSHPAASTSGSASVNSASSGGVVPLHQRIAQRRRDEAAAEARAATKIGLRAIDEDDAEHRAAERAAERLAALRSANSSIASAVASVRESEAAERAEQERRRQHQNEERRRALDASQALRRETERHARLRARMQQSVIGRADGGARSMRDVLDESVMETRATSSILRSRPAAAGSNVLVSDEAEEDARVLQRNLVRQERAEHPIDAYQRAVRADLLRDRGLDDDTIAAIEADITDASLLQLADAHARSPNQPRR